MPIADYSDVQRKALVAADHIAEIQYAASKCNYAFDVPRKRVCAGLLQASISHAFAISFLLAQDPDGFIVSIGALRRPHIETFLRGIYFHSTFATNSDVDKFLESDVMPKVHNAAGVNGPITVNQLAVFASKEFARVTKSESSSNVSKLVSSALREINGLVHGGKLTVELQGGMADGLVRNLSPEALVNLLQNITALAGAASTYLIADVATERQNFTDKYRASQRKFLTEFKLIVTP